MSAAFDLAAYRAAHPEATPEDARLAHRDAILDDLHDQLLTILADQADTFQLAVLKGCGLRVGVQILAPDTEAPADEPPAPPKIELVH